MRTADLGRPPSRRYAEQPATRPRSGRPGRVLGEATGALGALRRGNQDLYRFEEKLETKEVKK